MLNVWSSFSKTWSIICPQSWEPRLFLALLLALLLWLAQVWPNMVTEDWPTLALLSVSYQLELLSSIGVLKFGREVGPESELRGVFVEPNGMDWR